MSIPRLSEEVKKKIMEPYNNSIFLLSAPTGSGKTWFITHELLQDHLNRNKEILLVVNRTVLKEQMLKPLFENNNVYNPEEMMKKKYIALDGITITTYQFLAQSIMSEEDRYIPKNNEDVISEKDLFINYSHDIPLMPEIYDTIVFDECHYLLADATFNPEIDALKNIPKVFSGKKRIYISATIEPVKNIIFEIEGIEYLKEYPYPLYRLHPKTFWNGYEYEPVYVGMVSEFHPDPSNPEYTKYDISGVVYPKRPLETIELTPFIQLNELNYPDYSKYDSNPIFDINRPNIQYFIDLENPFKFVYDVDVLIKKETEKELIEREIATQNNIRLPFHLANCVELCGAEQDYSYLDYSYANNETEEGLVDDIIKRKKDGELKKAIVFVSSKKHGINMKMKLNEEGIGCAFIFSEDDVYKLNIADTNELKSIKEKEQFGIDKKNGKSVEILLCTILMDNGVSIKDPDVTHIYPYGFDEISLKQQVGRIRRLDDPNQRVTMVLRKISDKELCEKTLRLIKEKEILEDFEKADPLDKEIIAEKNFNTIKKYTYRRRDRVRKSSFFAFLVLEHYISEYLNIVELFQENILNDFRDWQLQWFGISYDEHNDVLKQHKEECRKEIINLLDENSNKDLDGDEFKEIKNKFTKYFRGYKPEVKITSGRNDRDLGIRKFSNLIVEFNYSINKKIMSRKTIYRIEERK